DIIRGYGGLHALGYAHSSELWLDGELAGVFLSRNWKKEKKLLRQLKTISEVEKNLNLTRK
ncbi:MAG: hypothetical protein ACM31G_06910, partial [Flavobacteriales bacterium]